MPAPASDLEYDALTGFARRASARLGDRAGAVAAWLAAVLLTVVIAASGLLDLTRTAVDDMLVQAASAGVKTDGAVIVDIDEPSLRALGDGESRWPLARPIYARMIERLRAAGATSIGMTIGFIDSRPGDVELAHAVARAPVVLAAIGLQQPLAEQGPPLAIGAARLDRPGPRSEPWTQMMLPTAVLQQVRPVPDALAGSNRPAAGPAAEPGAGASSRARAGTPSATSGAGATAAPEVAESDPALAPTLGSVSVALDDDGVLRQLHVSHRAGSVQVPIMPVALVERATGIWPAGWDASQRQWELGGLRWPAWPDGTLRPLLPALDHSIARIPAQQVLVGAGKPSLSDDALRELVGGRIVVVGSSAVPEARVMTPQGQRASLDWIAGASSALATGQLLRPASTWLQAALWLTVLLPTAALLWRGRGSERLLMLSSLVALLIIGAGSLLAASAGQMLARPVLPALLVLALAVCGLLRHHLLALLAARRARLQVRIAHAANLAKSRFLADLSHEIRTPMTVVLGVADLLSETDLSPLQRRHVEAFRRSGETLSLLIDDLRDLSRIESGRMQVMPTAIDLPAVAREELAQVRHRAQARGLTLSISIDPRVPAIAVADPLRLRQVLGNLLANAVRYSPRGTVSLALTSDSSMVHGVRFTIRDAALGIDGPRLARMFEPFASGDVDGLRAAGDSGLGLTISRRLVELMGGRLQARHAQGHGNEVWFTLAMPPAPGSAQASDAAPSPMRRQSDLAGSPPPLDIDLAQADPGAFASSLPQPASATPGPRPPADAPAGPQPHLRPAASDTDDSVPMPLDFRSSDFIPGLGGETDDTWTAPAPTWPTGDEARGSAVPADASQRPVRLLLAEDNPTVRHVIRAMLNQPDLLVDVAADGREALERATSTLYDIILMDLQMPHVDGLQATRALREHERRSGVPRTCIVALTASSFDEDRQQAYESGCDEHLTKPVTRERLLATIARLRPAQSETPPPVPAQSAAEPRAAEALPSSFGTPSRPAPLSSEARGAARQPTPDAAVGLLLRRAPGLLVDAQMALSLARHDRLLGVMQTLRPMLEQGGADAAARSALMLEGTLHSVQTPGQPLPWSQLQKQWQQVERDVRAALAQLRNASANPSDPGAESAA